MKILTINTVPGRNFEALDMVRGTTVQSKHIGKDFLASFKTVIGGEVKSYTEMLVEAREIATRRMIAEAEALGADAVIGVQFGSSAIMQGAAEMIVYGTAVKFLD